MTEYEIDLDILCLIGSNGFELLKYDNQFDKEFKLNEKNRYVKDLIKRGINLDNEIKLYSEKYFMYINNYRAHNEVGISTYYIDTHFNNEFITYEIDGKFHNEDGPAMVDITNNIIEFFAINGVEYNFDDWCSKLNKSNEEISFLKLKYNI